MNKIVLAYKCSQFEKELDKMDQQLFCSTKTFDPNGQYQGFIKLGIDFEQAISTCYGVDLMQDNVDLQENVYYKKSLLEKNIV